MAFKALCRQAYPQWQTQVMNEGWACWWHYTLIDALYNEDREWFPTMAGSDWRESFDFAMRNFKDESFIAQYLSPRLMSDFHLFAALDNDTRPKIVIEAIHDENGYRHLRELLSEQYNLGAREPNIPVWDVDFRSDRTLTLRYYAQERRPLGETTNAVMEQIAYLWGFTVRLETIDSAGWVIATADCRMEKRHTD